VLAAGEQRQLREQELERIRYARLVRKGGGEGGNRAAHGPLVGYHARSALDGATSLCQGVIAGYGVDLRRLSLGARIGVCRATHANEFLDEGLGELSGSLRLAHAWDLPIVTVEVAVLAGGGVLRQTFTTPGIAPERLSVTGIVGAGAGLARELPYGF